MNVELVIIFIFWFLVYLPFHAYLIYPLSMGIFSHFKSKDTAPLSTEPLSVSIIISAFNEEIVIENRVLNIAELDYNFDEVEVLIGSDGSSDRTNEILLELEKKFSWLSVFIFKKQRGKSAVVNDLVTKSNNQILVFTDANTIFSANALTLLVQDYANSSIGGVCGRLILSEPKNNFNRSNREKAYWDYETLLKKFEGKLGVLISSNGGIYSVRKNLFKRIPVDKAVTDDLFTTLAVLKQGYQFSYNYQATASEEVSRNLKSELKRKIRFAATNFQTLSFFKKILFSRNTLLSYTFWSHKVFRWYMPFILLILLLCNIFLLNTDTLYLLTFYLQVLFYFLTLIGLLFAIYNIRVPIISLFSFFSLTNLALALGWVNYILGKHRAQWQSTPR